MSKNERVADARVLGTVRRSRAALMTSTALCATFVMVVSLPAIAQPAPNARPMGGVVTAGTAAITRAPSVTTVNQSSNRAAVDWQSFNVGRQQSVQFNQPSTSSVTLNRVVGPNPSQIAGKINANGQMVLVNRSGVVFYKGAQVNTAGLTVSAAGISNRNFMAGRMAFNQPAAPNARIVNGGTITVRQAGLAALVAPQVANAGVINAKLGHVVLAGARAATLDLYGDGLVSVDVTRQVTKAPNGDSALVTNTGVIHANGGTVQLTAEAVDGIVTNLVDARGKIHANSIGDRTGVVALNGIGGSIIVDGQLSARGKAPGTSGGAIVANTTGNVTLTRRARINASGRAGGGTIAIGTTLARAKGGPGVTPRLTAANVTVQVGAKIAANATAKGNGGRVTVLSGGATEMGGTISATGGAHGGNGGFVETSGADLGVTGMVDLAAPSGTAGTWLLDPTDLEIIHGGSGSSGTEDGNFNTNNGTISAGDGLTGNPDTVTDGVITQSKAATIVLQAQQDLTVDSKVNINLTQLAQSLVLDAGRALTINTGAVITAPGNITLTADDTAIAATTPPSAQTSRAPDIAINGSVTSSSGSVSVLTAGTGAIDVSGAIAASGSIGLSSGSGSIQLKGALDGATVDLATTGGGVNQTAGSISATTLESSAGGVAGGADFAGTSNEISNVGSFNVTNGNFSLVNQGSVTLNGPIQASGNVYVKSSAITFGNNSTLTAGVVGLQTDTLANLGGSGATGAVNAGTLELAPNTGTVVALGAQPASGLSLVDTTGINAGLIRIGAVTRPDSNAPTAIASLVSIDGPFTAGNLELDTTTSGKVTESAALTATTLSGNAGSFALTGAANAIATLGSLTAHANIAITDSTAVTVAGMVSGSNVYIEDASPQGITFSGGTVSLNSSGGTGTIGLQTNALAGLGTSGTVIAASHGTFELAPDTQNADVTLGSTAPSGLSLADLTGVQAALARIGGVTAPGSTSPATLANNITVGATFDASGRNVELDANAAVSEAATAVLTAGTLTGHAATVTLDNAGNAITGLGDFSTSNGFSLTDGGALTVSGRVAATPGAISLATTGSLTVGAGSLNASSVTLHGSGDITLDGAVNGSSSGILTLVSDSGSITGKGPLTAAQLTGNAAGSVTLNGTDNAIATLGSFAAGNGSFTLQDSGPLTIAGPVTAENVTIATLGTAALAVSGPISAGTVSLSAGGGIALAPGVALAGSTVDLSTAGGGISEATGSTIAAGTLRSNSGVHGDVNLTSAGNAIANLAQFTASSSFALQDASSLAITGPVHASDNISIATAGAAGGGSISASSGVTAGGALSLTSGAGGIVLNDGATVAAPTVVALNGGGGTIALNGHATLGQTGADVDLTTAGGGISEAPGGTLLARLLQSHAGVVGPVTLASTSNAIGTLGRFVVTGGDLNLADATKLSVDGPVQATNVTVTASHGSAVTIGGQLAASDSGGTLSVTSDSRITLANNAALDGAAITLYGDRGIDLTGNATLGSSATDTLNLLTTGGGISEAAGVSIRAGTLESTGGVSGDVSLGGPSNTIATLGPVSVRDGSLRLADNANLTIGGAVSARDVTVTTSGGGNVVVGPDVAIGASDTLTLASGSGGIHLQGGSRLSAATVDLSAAGGGVSEAPDAAIDTATLRSSGGVSGDVTLAGGNTIGTIGNFAVAGGPTGFSLFDTAPLTVSGRVSAGSISLHSARDITINGAVVDPPEGTVTLVSDGGSIIGKGQITAALLTGSAGRDVTLDGNQNIITALGNFSAPNGSFTLNDSAALLISGVVTSPTINIRDGSLVTLADGAGFVTSGIERPAGPIPRSQLPPHGHGYDGTYLDVGNFVQEGSSFVTGLNGAPPIVDINSAGNITFNGRSGLDAPDAWLELNLQGGMITGMIDVAALDFTAGLPSASADLFGLIDGVGGAEAAAEAWIVPNTTTKFQVNSCPVHSVNCVLLPVQSVPAASPLNDVFVGALFAPHNQGDLLLPIVSNEHIESMGAPAAFVKQAQQQQNKDLQQERATRSVEQSREKSGQAS